MTFYKTLTIPLTLITTLAFSHSAIATAIRPVRSKISMVASAHPLASQVGADILAQGGNAVDAAVATTLAISVVEPFSAGIGGGGFLLLKWGDNIKALNFREVAPKQATPNMYLDGEGKVRGKESREGYLSVGVPGTIAGLAKVHRQYGKLPWSRLVQPAINLAQRGFVVSEVLADRMESTVTLLSQYPETRRIFTKGGKPYGVGDRLIQTDLAKTLRSIAQNPNNFYTGNIAQVIHRDMAKNGGLITREDLAQYQPQWLDPLCGNFREYRVCSMPPPSSGGVHLLQMLNLIGDRDLTSSGWRSVETLHFLAEIMKIAYSDRATHLGDPQFVKVPTQELISQEYANKRRLDIDENRAKSSTEVKPGQFNHQEPQDTSHLTVVDGDRNVVSLTFTINYRFGSGVVVPGTGILLNNEMDDFAIAPGVPNIFGLVGGSQNAIAPRKTPLSSMTPTIVTENGQFRLALGAPGGSTIITTVLQHMEPW